MKSKILHNSVLTCTRLLFLLLLSVCMLTTHAQTASVITFEGVPEGSLNSISYSESDFTLEDGALSESLYIRGTGDGYASNTIFNSNFDRIIRLRKTNNTAFTLTSFDYAGGVWGDLADATVTGYLVGGGTVTSATSSGLKTYTNLVLNWTNLLKVEINFSGGTGTNFGALDNFSVIDESAGSGDTEAPSVPTALAASIVTNNSFTLTWASATDNIAVTGYDVYKDDVLFGSTAANITTLNITGLTQSTAYSFTVKAKDAAGNISAQSLPLNITTQSTGYRYLRLVALGGVSSFEPFITEVDWLAGSVVYPTFDAVFGSTEVTSSYNDANAYKLSDGIKTNASIWEGSNTFPYSMTFDLGSGVAINPTAVEISIEWNARAMSSFRCEGSNDSNNWTTLFTKTGLTESDWVRDATNTFTFTGNTIDTEAPSVPGGLVSSGITQGSFVISWSPSTDNEVVSGYEVFLNGVSKGTTASTSLTVTGLLPTTTYAVTVQASDVSGNISAESSVLNVTTLAAQTGGYRYLRLVALGAVSSYDIFIAEIDWISGGAVYPFNNAVPGSSDVTTTFNNINAYKLSDGIKNSSSLWEAGSTELPHITFDMGSGVTVLPDHVEIAIEWNARAMSGFKCEGSNDSTAWTTLFTKTGLTESSWIRDAVNTFDFSEGKPDTIPPAAPTGLAAALISGGGFRLSWQPSTDNRGVTGYDIYKDGVLNGSTTGSTTFLVEGLSPVTTYAFTVRAKDSSGNVSAPSAPLSVTTDVPDTILPTAPQGLTASSIGASSFRITWQASTDNYLVSRYIVYLGNDSVGTVTGLTYTYLGLTAATAYTAKVVAVDNSGNKSIASTTVNVTTGAFQPEGFTENFNDGNLVGWNGGSYGLTNENNTLKVVANKGGNVWSAFSYTFNLTDISRYPYITFKAKSKFDVNIAVAVGNLPVVDVYPSRIRTVDGFSSQEIISGNSEWQEYTYDFTGVTGIDLAQLDYIQFLINPLGTINAPLDSNVFYIEDLKVGIDAKPMAAVTSLRDISFNTGTIVGKKIQFYGLTDGSDDTHPLTITASSSNTAVVPNPVIDYTSPAKTGMITITPNNGITGEAVITLKVAAAGVQDKLSTFKVTVTGNQQPVMKPLTNLLANLGDTIKIPLLNISDGDGDEEQTVAITAASNNATVLPAGNITVQHTSTASTGVLKIVSAPAAVSGSTPQVTVFLKDNGGVALNGVDSNKYNFNITFYTKVNHQPTLTSTGIVRLAARVQPYSLELKGITDGDDGTQTLTTTVTALSNTVGTGYSVGAITNGTASLSFNLTGNIGTDRVVVRITDNGGAGNNGALFVEDTITIIGNVAPQTWFVNNFDNAGAISAWYGDASAHILTVENQQLHIKTNIQALTYPGISVDLLAQTGGKYVDMSSKKYISFNMKAATTNTNKPGTISIALLDDDALAAGYYTRTIFTQNIPADGLVHHYVFNYTNKFYTENNLTLDSTHIKGLLINIDNDYFNAYKGDYYIDDFKIGDSAEVTFIPVNTIAEVSDQTYLIGQTPAPITLTGIADGAGQNATGLTVSANNAVVQNLAVTPAANGNSQLSFTLNTTVTDSSIIRVIADNPAISTDIPDTVFVKVYVVDTATAGTNEVQIDLTKTYQTMIGLGSVGLSNSANGFEKTTEQNITLMRIFGDFDEMENQNDNGDPYTLNVDNLSIDQGKLDYYKKINETTNCHQFFYTVLGPPAWLKSNKSRYPDANTMWADNNRLNPGLYEEYAEFLVAIIKIFKEKAGIDLMAISIQNEPQFNQPYPSCQISGAEFVEIMKTVGKRFEREGITTRLIMPEDVGLSWTQEKVNPVIADPVAVKYLDIIAVHNYGDNGITAGGGSESAWQDTYNWFKTTPGKDLWMTETSGFTNKWEGEMIENYLNPGQYEYAPGPFGFAGFMFSALKKGKISAWVDLDGKENSPSIRAAFKQYSKFVQPGDVMVDANSLNNQILSIAFKNVADDGLTIVLYNTTYQPQKVRITGTNVPLRYTSVYTANNVNFIPGNGTDNGYYLMMPRSIVTLKSVTTPLPVSLVNLKATRVQKTIDVSWKTQTENNNKGFYIERSVDGVHFIETIGFAATKAPDGFSSNTLSYKFKDAAPLSGRNYYRLRQVDVDAHFVYSNIVYADMDEIKTARVLNIRPNPVQKNQQLNVVVETTANDMVTLQVIDLNGRIVAQKAASLTTGSNLVSISTSTFSPGVYYFKLISKNQYGNDAQRFVVQ